ncbi:hypothetical protein V2W45_1495257 [Cenococcum geophilum]
MCSINLPSYFPRSLPLLVLLYYNWSYILIPSELKSNPWEDNYSSTWLNIEFDRLRVVRSTPFNINKIWLEEFIRQWRSVTGREYKERPKEGLLLKEVIEANIKNIARYYHYKTVLTNNKVDDVLINIRRGLSNIVLMPPPKWLCLDSPVKNHFRKSVYKLSSLRGILVGLLSGIKDISIRNVMLNIAEDNGFLINLNLTIKTNCKNISRAPSKTRTKVFIVIGTLYSEDYSFIYDLESTKTLIKIKKGSIDKEDKFIKKVDKNVTTYYALLIPYIKELRKVVFLKGKR